MQKLVRRSLVAPSPSHHSPQIPFFGAHPPGEPRRLGASERLVPPPARPHRRLPPRNRPLLRSRPQRRHPAAAQRETGPHSPARRRNRILVPRPLKGRPLLGSADARRSGSNSGPLAKLRLWAAATVSHLVPPLRLALTKKSRPPQKKIFPVSTSVVRLPRRRLDAAATTQNAAGITAAQRRRRATLRIAADSSLPLARPPRCPAPGARIASPPRTRDVVCARAPVPRTQKKISAAGSQNPSSNPCPPRRFTTARLGGTGAGEMKGEALQRLVRYARPAPF